MTEAIQPPDNRIGCSAGCGVKVEEPELVGWTYLEISKRWRCPDCTRQLDAVKYLPAATKACPLQRPDEDCEACQ